MNEWVGGEAICLSEWRRQGLLAVALVAAVGCVDWSIIWHRGQKRCGAWTEGKGGGGGGGPE